MASRAKKFVRGISLLLLAGVIFAAWFYGPFLYSVWKRGFFDKREIRSYSGNSMQNLAALHKGMMMYHDSEGQFPHANGWMDALKPYIRPDDMKEKDAFKKFVNPTLPAAEGVFGYGMNDLASAKYKDDVPFPEKTPLLFDSSNTKWNAHGVPEKLLPKPPRTGGNLGVSVSGTILKL